MPDVKATPPPIRAMYYGFTYWGRWRDSEQAKWYFGGDKNNVVWVNRDPDVLFFSKWWWHFERFDKDIPKIFICGENVGPNYNVFDFSICLRRPDYDGRNVWVTPLSFPDEFDPPRLDGVTMELLNRKFCSFLVCNKNCTHRNNIVKALMEYKPVDCPGECLHNIDIPWLRGFGTANHGNKQRLVGMYKFNICAENSNTDGYVTEKLLDAYRALTVPIYWGSEGNIEPFTKDSMIYVNDCKDVTELVERVKEVDNNDDLYMKMLMANPIVQGVLPAVKMECQQKCVALWEKIREAVSNYRAIKDSR